MSELTAGDQILQQHYEAMEEEFRTAEEQHDETASLLQGVKQELDDTRQEVAQLKAEVASAESEKKRLAEEAHGDGGSTWPETQANAHVALEISRLTQRLNEALAEGTIASEERKALQKDIDILRCRVEVKANETREALAKLEESQKREASWKERFQKAHNSVAEQRQDFCFKMEKQMEKERELTRQLNASCQQVDALKTELEKKREEHKRTHDVLKNTSQAFGECIAAYKTERKKSKNVERVVQKTRQPPARDAQRRVRARRDVQPQEMGEIQPEPQPEGEEQAAPPQEEPMADAEVGTEGEIEAASEPEAEPVVMTNDADLSVPIDVQDAELPDHDIPAIEARVLPPMQEVTLPEGITLEQLKIDYSTVVDKFNDEVSARMIADVHTQSLEKSRKKLLTEKRITAFEMSELTKISEERAEEIEELKEKIKQQDEVISKYAVERTADVHDKTSLQRANDGCKAQAKFLLKRIETLEQVAKEVPGAKPLPPDPNSEQLQPTCVHDIVESNMELTIQKHKLELEVKDLTEKLEKSKEKKPQGQDIAPVYEEQDGTDTQKRISADQPGPSKKKQKTKAQEPSTEAYHVHDDASVWREKWEQARAELSDAKAAQAQLKTELTQQLERVQMQNELYLKDLKTLDHNLLEYQAKYNALADSYKAQGEEAKRRVFDANRKIKELEAVIAAMTREADTLNKEIADQKAASEVDAHKLRMEKKMFNDLQSRTILMERDHLEEISKMKKQHEDEMAEKTKRIETADAQEKLRMDGDEEALNLVHNLQMQLRSKEAVISDLAARQHAVGTTMNEEAVAEIQLKLQHAERKLYEREIELSRAEQELSAAKEQYEQKMHNAEQEHTKALDDMRASIALLETERDTVTLEVVKWKSQCHEYEAQAEFMKKQLEELDQQQRATLGDLEEKLQKALGENEELRTQVELKTAEVNTYKSKFEDLQKLQTELEAKNLSEDKTEESAQQAEASLEQPQAAMDTEPVDEGPSATDASLDTSPDAFGKRLAELASKPLPCQVQGQQESNMSYLLEKAQQASFKGSFTKRPRYQHGQRQYTHPIAGRVYGDQTPTTEPPAQEQSHDPQEAASSTPPASSGAEGSDRPERPKKKWTRIQYTLDPKKDDSGDDKKDKSPKQ